MTDPFHGAKLAILSGDCVVTILRDDKPDIPWPAYWDLPGGGREEIETPEACVLRELREELGLVYRPEDLHWSSSSRAENGVVWFFVSEQPDFDPSCVRFGTEGTCWQLATLDWFLAQARVVPRHIPRLKSYLDIRPARHRSGDNGQHR